MELSELRLGKYFQIDGKVLYLDNKLLYAILMGFEGYVPEPIPITKEWLEKLGAAKFPDGESFILMNRLVGFRECRNVFYDKETGVDLFYIHQLQNLYFWLTGSELVKVK